VSFAIILFLIFRFNFGENTEEEVCRNSVITRANSFAAKETVPFKCKRDYICISSDDGDCGMHKPEIKKVKTEDDVYQVLADELADCWWMFGEGAVNYAPTKFWEKIYCSICDQVRFDESVKKEIFKSNTLSQEKLFKYLSETKMGDQKLTYSEYLYGFSDLKTFKEEMRKSKKGFMDLDLDKHYYLMMGIVGDTNKKVVVATAAIGAGVLAIITFPISSDIFVIYIEDCARSCQVPLPPGFDYCDVFSWPA
jgi:hypothetical protein